MQLNQWVEQYLGHLRREQKSHNTIRNYRNDLACFTQYLQTHMKGRSFNEMTTAMIMEYAHYLEQKYPKSSNSRRRRIQALRMFFDFLMGKEVMPENPVKKAPVSPKHLSAPRPTAMSSILKLRDLHLCSYQKAKNDLEELIALRNLLLVVLIYGPGLKVSDLSELQVNQLLPGTPLRVMLQPAKRDPYSIPIPTGYTELLHHYLQKREDLLQKQGLNFAELLFNANAYRILKGGLSPRGIELLFQRWGEELAIGVTARELRQAAIFKWLRSGRKEATIKEWMGVAPSYSLAPFKGFIQEDPEKTVYTELGVDL